MRRIFAIALALAVVSVAVSGQTRGTRPRVAPTATPKPLPELKREGGNPSQSEKTAPVLRRSEDAIKPTTVGTPPPLIIDKDDSEDEVIKIETNFVTLPVTVLDRQGRFISGLTQRDFKVFEDGSEQKIEYFASVEKPFTVVLMLDTSPSTQYKIEEIRDAATSFVNQLRPNDQVMVVSFDRSYRVLAYPTSDRSRIVNSIRMAQFGEGTSIYDAVDRTINNEISGIDGRKAIVLFTDGVDTTSRSADFDSTVRAAEEAEALIYPVRYDTSGQYRRSGGRGVYIPRRRTGSILGDILAGVITGTMGGTTTVGGAGSSKGEYARGKEFLTELASLSGGRMFEADTTQNLDMAFRSIAEELRRQYSLGYYPETAGDPGTRKRINVRVRGTNLVVRTKRSYIVGEGG
ncbi:MAG: VWA domain-containing protein [Pyrinomonadaceae bacterium]